jgi:hypothetical protein
MVIVVGTDLNKPHDYSLIIKIIIFILSNVLSHFKDASGNGSVSKHQMKGKIRTQLELSQPLNTQ